jgi:homoserine acetyltransferase
MDLFDATDHGGSLDAALSRVRIERAMVIGVETDFLFPVEQQEELALGLQKHVDEVVFHRLASIQGHDSFLVDMDRFRPVMARFLS